MKYITIFFFAFIIYNSVLAQNTLKAIVQDGKTNELLIGTTVYIVSTQNGGNTNEFGFVELGDIPNGKQTKYLSPEVPFESTSNDPVGLKPMTVR